MPGTFADNPEDAGMFYQWNRKVGWSNTDPMVSTEGATTWNNANMEGEKWEKENDPCPEGWRVPTSEELLILRNETYVTSVWTTENGVNGRRFTDIANNTSIFLPAAGFRAYDETGIIKYAGNTGRYWSTTVNGTGNAVYHVNFTGGVATADASSNRANGICVRCVKDSEVGINEVSRDTETATPTGYFDILGRKLNEEPKQGLYIIMYDNGTAKKVVKMKE
jgi:uncharacterized protein (TIGR02145 family)